MPTETLNVIETTNGRLQISSGGETVGILVERDGQQLGTILDRSQINAFSAALSFSEVSEADRFGEYVWNIFLSGNRK